MTTSHSKGGLSPDPFPKGRGAHESDFSVSSVPLDKDMESRSILLLGSGGREHAFAWKLSQSPRCSILYIAPGNAGTMLHGTNVDLNPTDFDGIKKFVL